mmetsp:Transcript_6861/g.19186  ORF Transcript_6861/g.19186 Transcript_6861/m.19186 type:complete len:205 (-) Transcript_6861:276-890(-)
MVSLGFFSNSCCRTRIRNFVAYMLVSRWRLLLLLSSRNTHTHTHTHTHTASTALLVSFLFQFLVKLLQRLIHGALLFANAIPIRLVAIEVLSELLRRGRLLQGLLRHGAGIDAFPRGAAVFLIIEATSHHGFPARTGRRKEFELFHGIVCCGGSSSAAILAILVVVTVAGLVQYKIGKGFAQGNVHHDKGHGGQGNVLSPGIRR